MMKRPRLRAYLGLGLLAAGLCGLALSGDLILHIERFVAFYGLSLAGFALLATTAATLPLRGALVGTGWTGGALLFALLAKIVDPEVARILCAAVFLAGAVCITRSLRGRARTAPAFAWTLTLLVACLPVVHAWYWLAPPGRQLDAVAVWRRFSAA